MSKFKEFIGEVVAYNIRYYPKKVKSFVTPSGAVSGTLTMEEKVVGSLEVISEGCPFHVNVKDCEFIIGNAEGPTPGIFIEVNTNIIKKYPPKSEVTFREKMIKRGGTKIRTYELK